MLIFNIYHPLSANFIYDKRGGEWGRGAYHSSPSRYNSDDKNTQFCATASNAGKENRADKSGADERHRLDGVSGVILCDLNVKGSCRCLAGHSASVAAPAHSPSRIKSKPISCFVPSATLMRTTCCTCANGSFRSNENKHTLTW